MADEFDFFISYVSANEGWAKWVARALEQEGYRTLLQAVDFAPGSNFGVQMQMGTTRARHTLLVLTEASLSSAFVEAEWVAAFSSDPTGLQRRLIPIKIEPCEPGGLLAPIVHIDLTPYSD